MRADDLAVWAILALGALGFVALGILDAHPLRQLDVLLAGYR